MNLFCLKIIILEKFLKNLTSLTNVVPMDIHFSRYCWMIRSFKYSMSYLILDIAQLVSRLSRYRSDLRSDHHRHSYLNCNAPSKSLIQYFDFDPQAISYGPKCLNQQPTWFVIYPKSFTWTSNVGRGISISPPLLSHTLVRG